MRFDVPSDWTFWNDTIDNLFRNPNDRLESSVMTPYAFAAETRSWLVESRRIDPEKKPWGALQKEVDEFAPKIGPELDGRIGRLLADISVELGEVLRRGTSPRIRQLVDDLISQLEDPECCGAAWQDLVASAQAPTVALEVMRYRRDVLIDLTVFHGKGVELTGALKMAMGVLADGTLEVMNARALVGDHDAERIVDGRHAGLPLRERERLAHAIFASRGQTGRQVVWIWYERARVPGYWSVGKVSMFDSEMLRDALRTGEPYNYWMPEELRGINLRQAGFDNLSTDFGAAMLRVDLGILPAAEAIGRALEGFEAIRVVVAPDAPGWRRSGRVAQFIDGRPAFYSSGVPETETVDYLWDVRFLEDRLDGYAEWIDALTPVRSPELRSAISYLSAMQEAEQSSAQASILASVNAAEHVNGMVFESRRGWSDEVRRALINRWVLKRVQDDAVAALSPFASSMVESMWLKSDRRGSRLEQFAAAFVNADGDVSLTHGLEWLRELRGMTRPESYGGRLLASLQAYTDRASARRRLAALRNEFELNLARLHRARNAAAHGGPISYGAVEDAQMFGSWCGKRLIRAYIDSMIDGQDASGRLSSADDTARQRLDKIADSGIRVAYDATS